MQLAEALPRGCLNAMQQMTVAGATAVTVEEALAPLLAAAPHVEELCLLPLQLSIADLPMLLQPLEHAPHLYTLYMDTLWSDGSSSEEEMLTAASSLLSAPAGDGDGRRLCPSLKRLQAGNW